MIVVSETSLRAPLNALGGSLYCAWFNQWLEEMQDYLPQTLHGEIGQFQASYLGHQHPCLLADEMTYITRRLAQGRPRLPEALRGRSRGVRDTHG
jgi:hypothetical protein